MEDLFSLMKRLEKEKWSGEIQVIASEGNALILLQKGKLLYAYRPIDRAAERLQKLGWVELPPENIISKIRSWEDFVRQILNLNTGNYEALLRYFKTERFEVFFRIFFWSNIELIPRPFEINLAEQQELHFYKPKELSRLVQEAQTRLKEWPKIQERVASSRRVFISQLPSTESSARRINPDAIDMALSEFTNMSGLDQSDFTEEELDIIRLCDGKNTLQEIIRLSPDGEFLTLRRIVDLWDRHIILPKEDIAAGLQSNSKSKTSAKTWNDLLGAVVTAGIFLLIVLTLSKSPSLQPIPRNPHFLINQALEIYRAETGRYPLTLNELDEIEFIDLPDQPGLGYELENLNKYRVYSKP